MWPLDNYSLLVTFLVLLLHLLLLLAAVLLGRKRKRPLSGGELLFCAVVPVFGPVCGLELIYAEEPDPELAMENYRQGLMRINSQERYDRFLHSGFRVLLRDEGRSIEETLGLVEKAFGLSE